MPRLSVIAGIVAVLAFAAPAQAAGRGDPNDPNWPCVQRKVPEIDVGAVWTGPPLDPAALEWEAEADVPNFVAYLAQRRVPFEEADAAIAKFAADSGDRKAERLQLLFAGLFEQMNIERKEVMSGIDRYATKQRRMADALKIRNTELETLRNDPKTEFSVLQAKTDEMILENRIFDERQKALVFVCEVPVLIEQRLFHLSKTISAALP